MINTIRTPINQLEHEKFVPTTYNENQAAVAVVNPDGTSISPDSAYVQFDPDDSQPNYIGVNKNINATDDDTDWTIYKFTYSGSNTTSIKRKTGAWSNRASLF